MTSSDVNRYIGLMWRLGGRGPDAYDCWGLLRECRERYFEGGIPETALGEQARALYAHKMRTGGLEDCDSSSAWRWCDVACWK